MDGVNVFRLFGELALSGTEQVTNDLQKVSNQGEETKNSLALSFEEMGTKAGELGRNIALGLAGAVAGAVALVESTRELRQDLGKLETTFQTTGHGTETATNTFKTLYGVLGEDDTSIEAANHLALMTKNEKELEEWTDILTGVYATFGDSLPLEGLAEAANETARVGQVTGPLADAINWLGVSEDEFNEKLAACNSEQERNALIRETLNGLYGEASEVYKETNADVIANNEAQAQMNLKLAEMSEKIQPIITKGKIFLTEVIDKLTPAITWIIDNMNILGPIILGFLGTLFALNIASKVKGMITVIRTLNATMSANPLGLIITIIGILITTLVLLVQNWDAVKEAAGKCWDYIKQVWEKVSKWFDDKVIKPVKKFFSGMWDGLKNGAKNAWDGIKNTFSSVATFFGNIFSTAWNKVKSIFSTGGQIFSGIKEGITTAFTTVVNAIIKGINKVVSVPFNFINGVLNKIRNIEILDFKPFSGLWGKNPISVPQIPLLWQGGVLEKGQTGYLEGNGAEAVVPLHNNKKWISAVADDMEDAIGSTNIDGLESKLDRIINLLLSYFPELLSRKLMLSTGELVGALVDPMDTALGELADKRKRGR